MYRCNLCPPPNPFRSPADHLGAGVMDQHMRQDHGLVGFRSFMSCRHTVDTAGEPEPGAWFTCPQCQNQKRALRTEPVFA